MLSPFGVLAQEAIGILVGTALPRVVRHGEVEPRRGYSFNLYVVMELSTLATVSVWTGCRRRRIRCVARCVTAVVVRRERERRSVRPPSTEGGPVWLQ